MAEAARAVLTQYCGTCHLGGSDTALPASLAIFDLSRSDWSASLDLTRMQSVIRRMGEPVPPDGEIDRVPIDEAQLVIDYLEAEAGRRWQMSP